MSAHRCIPDAAPSGAEGRSLTRSRPSRIGKLQPKTGFRGVIEGPDVYPWQEGLYVRSPYGITDGKVTVTDAPGWGWRSARTGWRGQNTG